MLATDLQNKVMDKLNEEFSPRFGGDRIQIRAGIHTGEVRGSLLGGSRRFKFEVFGANVGLADKVQQACFPGELQLATGVL
jgi:class 3 adenylate cyclase